MESHELFDIITPRYPELKDKVAIVTGSSRGIGRGIALRLAKEGMKVVIHGLDPEEVAVTHAEFIELGVNAIAVATDLRETEGVDQLFDNNMTVFGTLDLLVNNAADIRRKTIFEVEESILDSPLASNVRGPYLCARRAADIMRRKNVGNIINISSVGGLRSHWRGLPYDITKGAIDSMTRAMALDLAAFGIRVNAIAPGAIRTEKWGASNRYIEEAYQRIPLGRFGHPEEIGAAVAFLASPDAGYITGHVFYIDGGLTAQLHPKSQPI